jgi:hypothetical protein
MLDRGNAILECIKDRGDQGAAGIGVTSLYPNANPTAAELVDALIDLFHVTPTAAERLTYIDYLGHSAGALGVPVVSAFNALDATQQSELVRGLLYIITQHPSYAVR